MGKAKEEEKVMSKIGHCRSVRWDDSRVGSLSRLPPYENHPSFFAMPKYIRTCGCPFYKVIG